MIPRELPLGVFVSKKALAMKKLLTLLTLVFLLSGCKKDEETFTINPCGVDFNTTVKYMAVGDEFCTGFSLQANEAWPNKVRAYLIDNGYPEAQLAIIGQNGLDSPGLNAFITGNANTDCQNLSTVMVGVHDLLAGRTPSEFKTDFSALISKVIDLTGSTAHVTCVTLPDFSQAPGLPVSAGTPAEAKVKIEAYNVAIAEVSTELGVGFADVYPISEPSYSDMLTADEFHANGDQHFLWANVISGIVEDGLE